MFSVSFSFSSSVVFLRFIINRNLLVLFLPFALRLNSSKTYTTLNEFHQHTYTFFVFFFFFFVFNLVRSYDCIAASQSHWMSVSVCLVAHALWIQFKTFRQCDLWKVNTILAVAFGDRCVVHFGLFRKSLCQLFAFTSLCNAWRVWTIAEPFGEFMSEHLN